MTMPIRKVGKDVAAAEYWRERAGAYAERLDGPYHRHRAAIVKALLRECPLDGRLCVDVGCGEGVLTEYLVEQGSRIIAFDPSDELVAGANERFARRRWDVKATVAGLDALSGLDRERVDYVLAINVLAYFSDAEEEAFYREAARILRPGGMLVVTHSNELFDLYSLNAFTVAFFTRHLCADGDASRVGALLTHANRPERVSFNVRENPLTYRLKLADHGFDELQQEFGNLHEVPPLLMDPDLFVDIDRRTYVETLGWPERDRWKLMFVGSMFGSRSARRRT